MSTKDRVGVGAFIHNRKANPLHPNLHDAQQPREAREPTNIPMSTASHIRPTARQREDVRKLTCS